MIKTDGRPTIAWADLSGVIRDRDPGDETPEDRFLLDESELRRQLTEAYLRGRADGFDDGYSAGYAEGEANALVA